MNMFWQNYLENKKPTFITCMSEQVYAAILEYSKDFSYLHLLNP